MKIILLVLLMVIPCQAFEVSFDEYNDSCDLVSTTGASYIMRQASEESPFMGGGLNGLNYFDLSSALHREGFCTVDGAEGGAMSFDLNGWRGYQSQIDRVLAWSIWPPGVGTSQIDYALVGGMNDCWHSGDPRFPCDDLEMDVTVQNAVDVARRLAAESLCVVVTDKPDWESLHLNEAMAYYGLIATTQADYEKLKDKWYTAFMPLAAENIHLVFTWSKGSEYPDGLHPPMQDQKKAARKIRQAFKRYCQ